MLNILNKEIRELFADKKIWIGIITVLIIIIIGTSYNIKNNASDQSDILRLGVINNDDSSYSDLLLQYFESSKNFSSFINVRIGDEKEIKGDFEKGRLDIYLEIPKDFASNMIQIKNSPVNVTINIEDTTKALLFKNILQSYEKYIAAVEVNAVGLYDIMEQDGMDQQLIDKTNTAISLDLIFTALGKEDFFTYHEAEKFPATKISEYYLISILVMALMYMGLIAGFKVLREIRQGTFLRLQTTKTPLYQFLTAKILFLSAALSIFAFLSICIIRKGSFNMSILGFSIAAALFCVTMPMLLCAFFKTTQRYMLVGNLFIFYFIVIGGGIIPIMFLPEDIIRLAKMTPNYYLMEGMIRLNQGQKSIPFHTGIILILISAVGLAAALLLFGRRRFAYEEA